MSWTDSLGKMAKNIGDFTGISGLMHDVSTAVSNSDPWYVDALNIVKDVAQIGTTPVRGAVKGLFYVGEKSYEAGGWARRKISENILDTPFMYNKYKNKDESYDDYRKRVAENKDQISLGQTMLSVFSPGKNSGDKNGWFQDWTENNLRFMSAGFDIFNPEDRQKAFSDQVFGKFISGAEDLVASTFIDPLMFTGFLGKGAVIASKGLRYENITGKMSRAVFGKFAATNESMVRDLNQGLEYITSAGAKGSAKAADDIKYLAESDAASQAGYWANKKVTNPDAMAYLFGRASSPEEVVQTFKAVLGKDTKAMSEIATKDPEAALVLDAISDTSHAQLEMLNGKLDGDILVSPTYTEAMSTYVKNLAQTDTRYRAALDQVATGGTEFKYGFESGLAKGKAIKAGKKEAARAFGEGDVTIIQKTSLHPALKVINYFKEERPSGVFNVNDGNSYREFNVFLREANDLSGGTFGAEAKGFADSYLAAQTEGERLSVIKSAEAKAIEHLFPGYTDDELKKIYKIYDARRATAIEKHNNQGFISYFDGDQLQHAVSLPVLRSESANTVIIADLRRLKYGLDAHSKVLPSLLSGIDVEGATIRGVKAGAAMDTINDIFKTSVLMRLGYTVRNLTEAQLSMLAKGFALPAVVASGGKEAVGRFLTNRKTNFARLADHVNVMTGRVEDINVMQANFAHEADKLRAIDQSRQQLAKAISDRIGEIERDSFHLRLTGDTAPLTMEDEVRTLKGALSDIESVTLYHGSAEPIALDKTRVLATSASHEVARRYAEGGTIHSIEQYKPTKTGKPGKLVNVDANAAIDKVNALVKKIDAAEKELAQTGKTQWDIPLLKQTLAEARAEYKKANAAANRAIKTHDVQNEAMLKLQSDMIDAVNAGRKVEVKDSVGNWRKVKSIDYNTLVLATEADDEEIVLFKNFSHRPVFRVNATQGKVEPYRVYGKPLYMTKWSDMPLELRQAAFGNKMATYKSWVKSKGWSNPNDPVIKYMRENGYGRAVVVDDRKAGGISHIALPESIGKDGRNADVDRNLKAMMAKQGEAWDWNTATDFEQKFVTKEERRLARRAQLKRDRSGVNDLAVSPYYTKDNVHAMINNGVEDAAENLARMYSTAHAHLDDMAARIGARIDKAESLAVKQRIGYGTNTIEANGHSYELPKVFENASWFLGRTSAEQTWNAMVASQEMAFTTGIGSRTVRLVQPTDPQYFQGWANILNMHFRNPESGVMDPVVEQIIKGKDDASILRWFKTHEGSLYANNTYTRVGQGYGFTKIKGGELDEHLLDKINTTRGAVRAYIPDAETADMLMTLKVNGKPLTGGEVQKFLLERFGKTPEKLTPLNGLLVTTSKEYKDQERIIDTINRRVMRFLGSLPEDTFARHPLANAVYEDRLRKNIAAMADMKGTESLTGDELNRAVKSAREAARQEVERTLFTIVRRTGASSSQTMKLLFPFYAAFENTAKRWTGMVAENPMIPATAARVVAQVIHGQMVVDQDGNRVTDITKLTGKENLVVRVPQGFINSLPKSWRGIVEDSFKNINIPLTSLDVITQGNPGNPGFGPFAVLPAYLILKQQPSLEKALEPFFPAGMPQSAMDIFTPSALRRLGTVWRKDDLYVRTFNQMLRYETYRYNQGERTDAPTVDEITSRTNKFYFLRALTSISMPFAVSPEVDFYQQTFRQLQAQYADYKELDPKTGKMVPVYGKAEAEFLRMYPDFFEATVSLSQNEGGLEPSVGVVQNLKKFSSLMANANSKNVPELMGFLADDGDGKYTFSQAAYQWQYSHGSAPGTGSNYRKSRDAGELQVEANIKRGWTEYQGLMNQINAWKIQNGIEADNDPRMKQVQTAKQLWLQWQAQNNLDWYSEYASPDRAKYARRAEVLEAATQDKNWMAQNGNRTVVKNLVLYLDTRKQIAKILDERYKAGGSRSMSANSNADLAWALDKFRTQLIVGSPETESFLNRYFANDTVVI